MGKARGYPDHSHHSKQSGGNISEQGSQGPIGITSGVTVRGFMVHVRRDIGIKVTYSMAATTPHNKI